VSEGTISDVIKNCAKNQKIRKKEAREHMKIFDIE
jgi:hypothetical protein